MTFEERHNIIRNFSKIVNEKDENMKVITIKQPWATLIAKGYKEYEFRTWKTKYRGDILIHAGKGTDKEAMTRFKDLKLEYPKGCIIAKAKITDCIYVDDNFRKKVIPKNPNVYKSLNNTEWKGYGFKIEEVEEIRPIEINGMRAKPSRISRSLILL